MSVRSLQDHITSLVGRNVAEAKVVGSNSPDLEARAIIESIALNLLLKPKSVLYAAHLARNGLQNVVTQEIAAVDAMSKTVDDLANTTFSSASTLHLDKATNALLQIEGLEKIDINSQAFKRFDKSIDDFLNKSLAKTVRRLGNTELSRPSTEAAADLPTDFSSLESLHEELLSRLYALSVGVENFTTSPLGTILGLTTAYRARVDIQDITDIVNAGESGTQARDIAIRLLGDRAAMKSVGSLPTISAPLLDTLNEVPTGFVLQAQSDPATASVTSAVGPFVFSALASATITVNGTTLNTTRFPQTTFDLQNKAFVVSEAGIVFPVTIPATYYLFIHLTRLTAAFGYALQTDGTYLKQIRVPFTAGPISLSQVVANLNSALGSDGVAAEYINAGTSRILIAANSPVTMINIAAYHTEPSASSLGDLNVFTNSADTLLGFFIGQHGVSGSTPIQIVVDAFNRIFGSLITASVTPDQRVLLTTLLDSVGTYLTVTTDTSLAINGTSRAQSSSIRLFGTVYGVATDPVDPAPLMDPNDVFKAPTGTSSVLTVNTTRITLASPLNTFSGNVTVTSALVDAFNLFEAAVQSFLTSWLETDYAKDLTTLNRAVAVLSGKATPATRNAVKAILSDLKTQLQSLASALTLGPIPTGAASEEQAVVAGVISSLIERKYDQALTFFLELRLQELFELTGETASFGGNVLKTMSDLAASDIVFPNTKLDEDKGGIKGVIKEPSS